MAGHSRVHEGKEAQSTKEHYSPASLSSLAAVTGFLKRGHLQVRRDCFFVFVFPSSFHGPFLLQLIDLDGHTYCRSSVQVESRQGGPEQGGCVFKGTWDSWFFFFFIYSRSVTLAKSLVLRATVAIWPSFHSRLQVGSTRRRNRRRGAEGGFAETWALQASRNPGPCREHWAGWVALGFRHRHSVPPPLRQGARAEAGVAQEQAAAAGRTKAAAGSERSGRGGRAGRRRRSDSSGLAAAAASEV